MRMEALRNGEALKGTDFIKEMIMLEELLTENTKGSDGAFSLFRRRLLIQL